jgi:hypothetical protein
MMSIKGYKSQQALQRVIGGFTENESTDPARFVTVQELSGRRHALDVLIHGVYQISIAPITILAGSNIRVIQATAHGALKNDLIRLSDGTEFSVLHVPNPNAFITSVELNVNPVGDTFTVWRHITPSYNNDGSLNVTANQGLPITGAVMPAGGTSTNGWLSAIYTKLIASITTIETPKALTYAQSLTLDGTTAQVFTPPANAKNLKIIAGADNTVNIMVAFGGTVATATVGQEIEPSRSEDYCGVSSVSVICKSAITAHKISLVWSV